MGTIAGVDSYQASGQIGVAVLEGGVTLAINDFSASTEAMLTAILTIRGNLEKRPIDLGAIPPGESSFQLELPAGTDISLFNTLLIRDQQADITIAQAAIA